MSRSQPNEMNGRSKLKKEHVYVIRKLYAERKNSQIALGVLFGVSQSTISRIVRNLRWK